MRKLIGALLVALSCAVAAPAVVAPVASAHITDTPGGALGKVMNAYSGHCGNGATWKCNANPYTWNTYAVGAHSLGVYLQWEELYVVPRPGPNWRFCAVRARVEHGAVVQIYEGEHCWWEG